MVEYISIGSTRNRQFYGIVRSSSLGNELLGRLGFLRFNAGNSNISVLCQIISVDRRNTVHEDGSFGPVIAARGSIPYLSSIGDYEEAIAKPIAQQVNGSAAPLRANPPSGSQIVSLDDNSLMSEEEQKNPQIIFNSFAPDKSEGYLRYPGSLVGEAINVPIICKSFNPADDNGWGEARHAIFLGRSGSGKTHAAKIMLALYLLSTRTMGAFIPDGKGDFIRPSGRDLNLRNFLEANGRNVQVIHIEDLRLENTDQLQELLSIENFQRLVAPSIAPDKWRLLLELTLEKFTDEDEKLIVEGDKAISQEKFLEKFNDSLEFVYAETGKKLDVRIEKLKKSQEDNLTKITSLWNRVLKRFTEGEKLIDIVDHVLIEGKIYFLNIDSYNTSVNVFILGTLYKRFRSRALNLYKSRQKYANAIVYVDEANRFIPQSPKDEKQKELQEKLIDGIKTTRQYGLAWWLADQRPSAISKDAFTQMGTFFFGKGMTAVADQTNMESVLGKDGCNVYSYVATMGGSPFVASGQFIGVGSSESVAVPMQFFKDWQTLADQNNETLDACIQAGTTNNNS
ncbi:Genome sequencing data, contig C313 [Microcystis aeruginosa PCC 9809]|uniref:Genome sequencing data, contig C313 n=3 Tax=Microcystis TaxID=1125 RepID=I4HNE1_MICAE|nr:ATP-binding protein [Microcystis aeruginosa]CCI23565.1 Genome sequencing data, contig C313 [Microcystis aeruginosa PCC 9809]